MAAGTRASRLSGRDRPLQGPLAHVEGHCLPAPPGLCVFRQRWELAFGLPVMFPARTHATSPSVRLQAKQTGNQPQTSIKRLPADSYRPKSDSYRPKSATGSSQGCSELLDRGRGESEDPSAAREAGAGSSACPGSRQAGPQRGPVSPGPPHSSSRPRGGLLSGARCCTGTSVYRVLLFIKTVILFKSHPLGAL